MCTENSFVFGLVAFSARSLCLLVIFLCASAFTLVFVSGFLIVFTLPLFVVCLQRITSLQHTYAHPLPPL